VNLPGAASPNGEKFKGLKFPRSKVTWPALKRISIRRTRIVDLEWVNISRVISGVSKPKFTIFVQRGIDRAWLRRLPLVDISIRSRDIRGQSRKLSLTSPIFERFLPSQILRGKCPPPKKSCSCVITPI